MRIPAPLQKYWQIVALAAPITGIQLAQIALTSVDLAMMGLIGIQAVAAGGLAILLYNQIRTMAVGMTTGVGNLVAAARSRGTLRTGENSLDAIALEEIRELLRGSLLTATLVAVVAAGVLILLSRALAYFDQDPAIVAMARPVMLALTLGLLPMLWLNVLRQFAVGMQRAGSLLRVTLLSIGLNALLNAIFIYGWLGVPMLGLTGIGLATSLVQAWSFIHYLRLIRRDPQLQPFLLLGHWKPRTDTMQLIARWGFPISLTYGSEAAITSVAALFIGTFGPVALAASNVVNQLAYIVYQINVGLSQSSSILISAALARKAHAEIAAIAWRALEICAAAMLLAGLIYVAVPAFVLRPFLGPHADAAVLSAARTLLWVAIAHQFLKGSQNIGVGLLRGLGKTATGFKSALVGYWLIGIPAMAAFGFAMKGGSLGVWLGLCVGLGATSLILWRHFLKNVEILSAGP